MSKLADVDLADLRRRMASLPDERLLEIVTRERRQYRQVALELAETELRRRGMTAETINRAAQMASQQARTPIVKRRLPRTGQDLITNGCLGITVFVLLSVLLGTEGFAHWFWPGLLGWFVIPLLLASLFGLAHWLLTALKRKP
jgi:hypothetical protein